MGQGNALDVGRASDHQGRDRRRSRNQGSRPQLYRPCYPMGRGLMAMMSAMAEDERLRIIKRTHEGRQIARAKGVRMGRKPKLTPHQIKAARQRLAKGAPTRDLAKSYGVSVSTISRLTA